MIERERWYHKVFLEDGANDNKPSYDGWISTENPHQLTDSFYINRSEQDLLEQGYFVADFLKDKLVDDKGKPIDASHIYEENEDDDEFPLQHSQSWLFKDEEVPTVVKQNCKYIDTDEQLKYWQLWNKKAVRDADI